MSRKRTIAAAGLGLLALLALADRTFQRSEVTAGRVSEVAREIPQRGPDIWVVSVLLDDGREITLEPTPIRPVAAIGTAVCVHRDVRAWAGPKHRLTADTSC